MSIAARGVRELDGALHRHVDLEDLIAIRTHQGDVRLQQNQALAEAGEQAFGFGCRLGHRLRPATKLFTRRSRLVPPDAVVLQRARDDDTMDDTKDSLAFSGVTPPADQSA